VNFSKRSRHEKRKTPRSQALAPHRPKKEEEEQIHRHTVKNHVEENQTGSRLTCVEKEGVERGKKRRNGGRMIGGRGVMERSEVGWKGGRMK